MNRNRMVMVVIAVFIIGVFALSACADIDTGSGSVHITNDIERFIDREAGVVCWVFEDTVYEGGAGGLSCLPLDVTKLKEMY